MDSSVNLIILMFLSMLRAYPVALALATVVFLIQVFKDFPVEFSLKRILKRVLVLGLKALGIGVAMGVLAALAYHFLIPLLGENQLLLSSWQERYNTSYTPLRPELYVAMILAGVTLAVLVAVNIVLFLTTGLLLGHYTAMLVRKLLKR